MPLNEKAIRSATPTEKPYRITDGKGLTLYVNPDGSRWWRFRYRYGGLEKMLSMGTWPDTSLQAARERRDDARKLVARGIDPAAQRKAERAARANCFKAVADEWLIKQESKLSSGSVTRMKAWLEVIARGIGSRPIAAIEAPEILAVLRRVEHRGKHETAHRMRGIVSRIFRYAIATGRASRDPAADLIGALAPVAKTSYAAITDPAKVGALLRAIDSYQGQPSVQYALRVAPYVFVRPGELRGARWEEFDLAGKKPMWRIPAARMKMDREHLVPLARQVVALIEELAPMTGDSPFLFPALSYRDRPISDAALNAALRRMGYSTQDEMTGHGFRSTASTLLNEQGHHPELIELQLAHQERNQTRAAYNRALKLSERRQMMQAWADYLDGLRAARNVRGNLRRRGGL